MTKSNHSNSKTRAVDTFVGIGALGLVVVGLGSIIFCGLIAIAIDEADALHFIGGGLYAIAGALSFGILFNTLLGLDK